jgi:glutathione S-transferase
MMTKIPYVIKEVRIAKLENRSSDYAKINPDRKVPTMRDQENNFTLFESHAIMRYLANSSATYIADHFYPKELRQRALVDSYLDWHH